MNVIAELTKIHHLDQGFIDNPEYAELAYEYFADQVDAKIQNALIAELMIRYSGISRELDEKNVQLVEWGEHLEDLVQAKVAEISESQIATIHALVKAAETRDDDTGAHVERTAAYCRILAEKLHELRRYSDIVDDGFIETIAIAAPLHDIGKIAIPDAILLKPGKLTDAEFEIMKTHVTKGYRTLASIDARYHENAFIHMGMEIAACHHEKWDGSGYMQGMSGDDIPLSARIMALSDVYDALRSRRVYKEPFSHEKAMSIIEQSAGSHFDPDLAQVFIEHQFEFQDVYDRLSGG